MSSVSSIMSKITENIYNNKSYKIPHYYFFDSSKSTYCELKYKVVKVEPVVDSFGEPVLDSVTGEPKTKEIYGCDGFVRHGIAYYNEESYISRWININQVAKAAREKCQYSDECGTGQEEYEHNSLECYDKKISKINSKLEDIAEKCNILKYIANSEKYVDNYQQLLRELNSYWIDGEYADENIAADDSTTDEELLQLSETLLDNAKLELSKMCQPRYSFSVNVNSAIKQFEFKNQMKNLELGRVISVEKKDGLWYYPALLEVSFGLDDNEEFTMSFANALRLDDWGYTYADLISNSSSTSRRVSANWSEIMKYVNDKDEIFDLISEPLNLTLRAGLSNATMQEFVIDDKGILGRKYDDESKTSFKDEQIRLINNLIMFTDDGWNTAKAAFGKVSLPGGGTGYGLIAEHIVGQVLIGNKLNIAFSKGGITLDSNGITIKKGASTTFKATTGGDVTIIGALNGGTINIGGGNFTVDEYGNVVMKGSINLNGNITWGSNANPFKELYARSYITKPNKAYSEYPESSTTDWHTELHEEDCYLSKSTDEGETWSEPILFKADVSVTTDNTLKFIYKRQASSSAPSKPTSSDGSTPSGWSDTPLEPTETSPYVFISQGVITGGGVSSWSEPVLFNRYISGLTDEQIQKAVNRELIFNILTSNGDVQGLFNVDAEDGNKLYINAEYIKAGTIKGELIEGNSIVAGHIKLGEIKTDHLEAGAITAEKIEAGAITAEKIEAGAITTEKLSTDNLLVGGWKLNDTMLYSYDNGHYVCIRGKTSSAERTPVVSIDSNSPEILTNGKFIIYNDGSVLTKSYIIIGGNTDRMYLVGDQEIGLKYDNFSGMSFGFEHRSAPGYIKFEYTDNSYIRSTAYLTGIGINIGDGYFENASWQSIINVVGTAQSKGLTGYISYSDGEEYTRYMTFKNGLITGIIDTKPSSGTCYDI